MKKAETAPSPVKSRASVRIVEKSISTSSNSTYNLDDLSDTSPISPHQTRLAKAYSAAEEFKRIDLTQESNQKEMKKKLIGHFHLYRDENVFDLGIYHEFLNQTEGENIIWMLINKLFDENED